MEELRYNGMNDGYTRLILSAAAPARTAGGLGYSTTGSVLGHSLRGNEMRCKVLLVLKQVFAKLQLSEA